MMYTHAHGEIRKYKEEIDRNMHKAAKVKSSRVSIST